MAPHETREAWLVDAVELMAPWYAQLGQPLPAYRVSCGWPGGRSATAIGECWPIESAADGVGQVFISPALADAVEVLATLAHELAHLVNHACGLHGHGKPFRDVAVRIGLEGKMTATHAGAELEGRLKVIADKLGPYPHAVLRRQSEVVVKDAKTGRERKLTPWGTPKEGTRMLKVQCPGCEWTFRAARSHIDRGLPTCTCGEVFELAD